MNEAKYLFCFDFLIGSNVYEARSFLSFDYRATDLPNLTKLKRLTNKWVNLIFIPFY